MKTVIIIGGTRQAARQKLQQMDEGTIHHEDGYDEVQANGHRTLAIGGEEDDVCWLQGLGFDVEIITVEPEGISEKMQKRINHVRSAQTQERNLCNSMRPSH